MDVLALLERIQKTIELGESQFREFKSALQGEAGAKTPRDTAQIGRDISETLVAFANADGGELLVGVEDDGAVTGVPHKSEQIQTLLKSAYSRIHSDTPLPSPIALEVNLNGKTVLYFSVDKSARAIHQTADGRCLQRRDRESVPVSAGRLQFEREEQISREYDRQYVDGASVTDLDLDLVKAISSIVARMSPEKTLQYFGLAEYGAGYLRVCPGTSSWIA